MPPRPPSLRPRAGATTGALLAVVTLLAGLHAACSPSPAGGDLTGTNVAGAVTPTLPPRYGFPVTPVGESGVAAVARVEASDASPSATAELTLVSRLAPGQRLLVYLRDGQCDALGRIVLSLGDLVAGSDGQAVLVVSQVDASGPQPLSFEALGGGGRVVSVHDSAGTVVACGAVPAAGSP